MKCPAIDEAFLKLDHAVQSNGGSFTHSGTSAAVIRIHGETFHVEHMPRVATSQGIDPR